MSRNIIFFGTPAFAVHCLKKIVTENFKVIAVVTAPDRPSGRGRQLRKSAVKEFSEQHKLPLLQPTNLKDPLFIDALKAYAPDLMIVVAFRMLPKEVWSIPPQGTFNLHASLLPHYRGAAPINWAIINLERQTGITTFFINEEIDTGAILLQEKIAIDKNETAGSLHDKLALKGSDLVCKTIEGIFTDKIPPSLQKENTPLKIAPKLNQQNTFIDWDLSLEHINAKVRGLSPYPGAKSKWIDDQKESVIKIFQTEMVKAAHRFEPKQVIIEDRKILIAHREGFIDCVLLQFPNKKILEAKDILNGREFSDQIRVE